MADPGPVATCLFTVRPDARGGRRLHLEAELPVDGLASSTGDLADEICAGTGPVTLDLPPRSCLAPDLMAALLAAACRLKRDGRDFFLAGVGPQDRSLLRLFCLGRLIHIAGERDEARQRPAST